jgi:hypothetical protein
LSEIRSGSRRQLSTARSRAPWPKLTDQAELGVGEVSKGPKGGQQRVQDRAVSATKWHFQRINVQVLSHAAWMTTLPGRRESALKLARSKGLLRAKEAAAAGVDRSTLTRLCERGLLGRLERGLYGLPAAAIREHVDLEIVAKRVPQAVFCLLTALQLHSLGAQQRRQVWICLPRRVHTPSLQFPPLAVIHGQPTLDRLQVETLRSGPIRLKVYGVEKTLADCLLHRRLLRLTLMTMGFIA